MGEYSVVKGQAKGVAAATGVFGMVFFAGWLAQIILPTAEEWKTLIPGEILTQSGMTAFIMYVWALIKDRLMMVGKWPKILG